MLDELLSVEYLELILLAIVGYEENIGVVAKAITCLFLGVGNTDS